MRNNYNEKKTTIPLEGNMAHTRTMLLAKRWFFFNRGYSSLSNTVTTPSEASCSDLNYVSLRYSTFLRKELDRFKKDEPEEQKGEDEPCPF